MDAAADKVTTSRAKSAKTGAAPDEAPAPAAARFTAPAAAPAPFKAPTWSISGLFTGGSPPSPPPAPAAPGSTPLGPPAPGEEIIPGADGNWYQGKRLEKIEWKEAVAKGAYRPAAAGAYK